MGTRRSERGRDDALPVLNGEVSEEAPKKLRPPSPKRFRKSSRIFTIGSVCPNPEPK